MRRLAWVVVIIIGLGVTVEEEAGSGSQRAKDKEKDMRILAVLILIVGAFVSEVSAQQVQGGGPRGTGENVAPAFVPNNSGDGATNLAEDPSDSALAAPSGYAGPVNRDLHKNGGRDMWSCQNAYKDWEGCSNHAGQNSYLGATAPNTSNFGTRSRPISEQQAP